MFSFRVFLTERDIAAYTNTLLMPSYMSHLCRETLDIDNQPQNVNGKESLKIYYSGEGRFEEISLDPDNHALAILSSLTCKPDPGKILLPSDSIWTWSASEKYPEDHSFTVNLYFKPKNELLDRESPIIYSPREAYASVSRRELFLGNQVIKKYVLERIRNVLAEDSPLLRDPVFLYEKDDVDSLNGFEFSRAGDGYRFRFDNIAGELIFDSIDIVRDLVHFARLDRALQYLSEFVCIDWKQVRPEISQEGFSLALKNPDPFLSNPSDGSLS